MARKQADKPFHKITMTHATLRMYVQYGEAALQAQTPQEFAADVLECMDYLMAFRNMVSAMSRFDETPQEAAKAYLDLDEAE